MKIRWWDDWNMEEKALFIFVISLSLGLSIGIVGGILTVRDAYNTAILQRDQCYNMSLWQNALDGNKIYFEGQIKNQTVEAAWYNEKGIWRNDILENRTQITHINN